MVGILGDSEEHWTEASSRLVDDIIYFARRRSLFKTKQGHLGLGPGATRQGDLVVVMLGCPNPMILRETRPGQFKVVGETYCDGIMSGEALQSPLPDNIEKVMRWNDEQSENQHGFLNTETEIAQAEDPRLADIPMPLDWRNQRA
jgi:hypothetical protein